MITHGVLTVGTAPSRIDGRAAGSTLLMLHNVDNTDALYLGGEGVTINDGLALLKEETVQMVLHPLEQLFVVATKEGHKLSWIRQEN